MTTSGVSADREQKNSVPLALLIPLLASMTALTPLAIDLYLPAMELIASHFASDITKVQNSLSIYLLGYALGLTVFGPLADKVSRRKLVLFGLTGFVVTSIALPLVSSISHFLLLRMLQAFISSAATVVVPGTIREIYGKNTAKGLSYVSMIMMLAPMIAPAIGSALLWLDSWQLIFYSLAGYSLLIIVLVAKYLPESKPKSTNQSIGFIERYSIVLSSKSARLDLTSVMASSMAFFAYITAIPFVYLTVFNVSSFHFSLLFAINVAALMSAHFINTRLVARKGSRQMLYYGLIVGVISSASLVTVSWWQLPLIYTVICIFPLMGSLSMILVNADALLLIQFAQQSGTATAVIGVLRFGFGALAGPILAYFYNGTALPFALLMASAIVVVLLSQFCKQRVEGASKK